MDKLIPSFLLVALLAFAASGCGPSAGETWTRTTDGTVMVHVPGGTFRMGSDDEDLDYALELCNEYGSNCSRGWFKDEQPVHEVALDGFWIDRTEVTNARFADFLNERGNQVEDGATWLGLDDEDCLIERVGGEFRPKSGYAEHPVVEVSWFGATAYCEWVGARLPTEAKWEYAARGPKARRFPWGDTFDGTRVNYCDATCENEWADRVVDDGYARTAPVGSYPEGASWCGALDLAGNVWEWTQDLYGQYPYDPESGREDLVGDRVVRGGSWFKGPDSMRSARRDRGFPGNTWNGAGFRCASGAERATRPPFAQPESARSTVAGGRMPL